MSGSVFGTIFRVSTWGESHGKAIGAVIDGCPAGLPLCEADIQPYLDRRKPGSGKYVTQRKEADEVQILSGIFDGKTTGTPISLLVYNTSQRSSDYTEIAQNYRPGHADYTFDEKYGFRDYRGGGRSSGRETTGRVAAGAIAIKILNRLGIDVCAYTRSIGPVSIHPDTFDREAITQTATGMPDKKASADAEAFLETCIKNQDSSGGVIECCVTGLPAGIGDPVFDKLDARLASAIMSIGAVKAVEIGDGIEVSSRKGSENNDLQAFQVFNQDVACLFHHVTKCCIFNISRCKAKMDVFSRFRTYVFAYCCYEGNNIVVCFLFDFMNAFNVEIALFTNGFSRFFRDNAQLSLCLGCQCFYQ